MSGLPLGDRVTRSSQEFLPVRGPAHLGRWGIHSVPATSVASLGLGGPGRVHFPFSRGRLPWTKTQLSTPQALIPRVGSWTALNVVPSSRISRSRCVLIALLLWRQLPISVALRASTPAGSGESSSTIATLAPWPGIPRRAETGMTVLASPGGLAHPWLGGSLLSGERCSLAHGLETRSVNS